MILTLLYIIYEMNALHLSEKTYLGKNIRLRITLFHKSCMDIFVVFEMGLSDDKNIMNNFINKIPELG